MMKTESLADGNKYGFLADDFTSCMDLEDIGDTYIEVSRKGK